jgi:hypothetical protein
MSSPPNRAPAAPVPYDTKFFSSFSSALPTSLGLRVMRHLTGPGSREAHFSSLRSPLMMRLQRSRIGPVAVEDTPLADLSSLLVKRHGTSNPFHVSIVIHTHHLASPHADNRSDRRELSQPEIHDPQLSFG